MIKNKKFLKYQDRERGIEREGKRGKEKNL